MAEVVGSKVGKRLSQKPAPEIIEQAYAAEVKEELASAFFNMTAVNQAHVVMLERQGIITHEVTRSLLDAIFEIERNGPGALELDPEREGLYYNYEHAVIAQTGPEVGGQMHTGRSRNDLGATITRMQYREVLLALIQEVLRLRSVLLEKAEAYADTIMPGYTHLQPAQPITLGHYLSAVESGLARDTSRLFGALQRTNLCPMGAAALAGTGFPIDREMVARLLGFDSPVMNTLDAVASRDYLLEALSTGAIMGITLSRFAQDLYVWYSDEFGMIGFNDRVAGTSSIMPQKKNPVVLEYIKGRTVNVLGAFSAAMTGVHSAHYTNVIDANRECFRLADLGLEHLRTTVVLSRVALENIEVREELMLDRCEGNFTTVTQLADTLVTTWGISFRQSHEVVGMVVRQAMDKGLRANMITTEMVREAAREVLGIERDLDTEVLRQALDPRFNVQVRNHTGGPAPDEVRRMSRLARGRLERDVYDIESTRKRISEAQRELSRSVISIRA